MLNKLELSFVTFPRLHKSKRHTEITPHDLGFSPFNFDQSMIKLKKFADFYKESSNITAETYPAWAASWREMYKELSQIIIYYKCNRRPENENADWYTHMYRRMAYNFMCLRTEKKTLLKGE